MTGREFNHLRFLSYLKRKHICFKETRWPLSVVSHPAEPGHVWTNHISLGLLVLTDWLVFWIQTMLVLLFYFLLKNASVINILQPKLCTLGLVLFSPLETFLPDQKHQTMFGHVLFIFHLNHTLILQRSGVSFHWRVNSLQSASAIKTNVFKSQRDWQNRLILFKFPGYKMAIGVLKEGEEGPFFHECLLLIQIIIIAKQTLTM